MGPWARHVAFLSLFPHLENRCNTHEPPARVCVSIKGTAQQHFHVGPAHSRCLRVQLGQVEKSPGSQDRFLAKQTLQHPLVPRPGRPPIPSQVFLKSPWTGSLRELQFGVGSRCKAGRPADKGLQESAPIRLQGPTPGSWGEKAPARSLQPSTFVGP